jgi:hypothetical protein
MDADSVWLCELPEFIKLLPKVKWSMQMTHLKNFCGTLPGGSGLLNFVSSV